jgi:hypothetical protein
LTKPGNWSPLVKTDKAPPAKMTVLSEELILQKTRTDRLESVRNLNLWGCALNDLSILRRCPNLQSCVVSKNQIRNLRFFTENKQLRELFIRKNEIDDLSELVHLQGLPALTVLQLEGNPVVSRESQGGDAWQYRLKVLAMLPRLQRLDNTEVTADDRAAADQLYSRNAVEVIAEKVPALKINNAKPPLQPRTPQPRPCSPRICLAPEDSPRAVPAVQGAGSANVLAAALMLARELTLDGLLTLKTEVDHRYQQAAARMSPR